MAEPVVNLQAVTHRYGDGDGALTVLQDVSMQLYEGQVASLMGPSGSGKSTLLQIAGLLDAPTQGQVFIDGVAASRVSDAVRTTLRRNNIGFIYQFHHLLGEFTALENVLMPLRIAGNLSRTNIDEAKDLLAKVGLDARMQHRPGEMSGGEKQRVAIARALIHHPRLVLADEPTGNLDEHKAEAVFDLFLQLVQERPMAVLIATHNTLLAEKVPHEYRVHGGVLEQLR